MRFPNRIGADCIIINSKLYHKLTQTDKISCHSDPQPKGWNLCFVADALFSQEDTRLNSAPQRLLSQSLVRRQLINLTRDFQTDVMFSNVL